MYNKEKELNGEEIEVVKITENGGEFTSNETKQKISYRKYNVMLKVNGNLVKCVVDKAFTEILDELLSDKTY